MSDYRIKKNLEVLAALKAKNNQVDLELLNEYSGWGGLREAIYTPSVYRELQKLLNEDELNSLKKTLTNAYYTPELLVKFMWGCIERMGFMGGNILEPSAGHGAILDHMPRLIKQISNIDAVEIDQVTCDILIRKHPEINVICSGFEKLFYGKGRYDLIIANPPFGKERLADLAFTDLGELRIHHFFVAKAARMLKDGGIIAMILPQFFLDNITEHARNIISNDGVNLIAAYRLPDNLFADAKVTVDIVFLQKTAKTVAWQNTKQITLAGSSKPLNEYFIDHPRHVLGELQIVPMYDRLGITL